MSPRAAVLAACLIGLLIAPMVSAHGAPSPRSYETRLLADCNDDWFGGDTISGRAGYDIHAVDVREAWDSRDHLVFRTIMNGDGQATIQLALSTSTGSKTLTWSTSGGAWSADKGTTSTASINDGDRFALEVKVPRSALGLDVGDRIMDYELTSTIDGAPGDRIPGNDNQLPGSACDPGDAPTSYKLTAGYKLAGPVQYAHFPARDAGDCRQGSATGTQTLLLDTQKFIDLVFCNPTDENQEFTLAVAPADGLDLQFHNPSSGRFSDTATTALQSDKGTLVHLAATATEPASGTLRVTLTSSLGGRVIADIPYEASASTSTQTPSSTDAPAEPTPGPGVPAAIGLLAAAALARRR